MVLLASCCFCFDLKDGSRIIGILTLIGAIINSLTLSGVVVMLTFLGLGADAVDQFSKKLEVAAVDYEDDYVDVREEKGTPIMEVVMNHIRAVTIMLYVMLALCLLMVVTSSMLIHGIKRNRRGLLIPFVVQEILNILFLVILVIWGFVVFGSDMTAVSSLLGIMGASLIHVYFGLVVFSQYQALGVIRMHDEIGMK